MYMFDGHNVFFDSDATFGKSWGMAKYMESTKKQLIIVAVACNSEGNRRLEEYSPVDFTYPPAGKITGRGEAYMNWLTGTLKPYIDSQYRTLPDPVNTIISGSSMGGLMSLYAACAYNHVFHKAACLSPSLWFNPEGVLELIKRCRISSETCIYMDYGSEEMKNHKENPKVLHDAVDSIKTKGAEISLRIIPGGTHCEASWEKQIPVFMDYLGL